MNKTFKSKWMQEIRMDLEIKEALNEMCKRGYLKKDKKGYVDSDRTKFLLNKGKNRQEIAEILDKEYKRRKQCIK